MASDYSSGEMYKLKPDEKVWIDKLLNKDKKHPRFLHTDTAVVKVPLHLTAMYERIGFEEAAIRKLKKEEDRLAYAIDGLKTSSSVAASKQLEAYKWRYKEVYTELCERLYAKQSDREASTLV